MRPLAPEENPRELSGRAQLFRHMAFEVNSFVIGGCEGGLKAFPRVDFGHGLLKRSVGHEVAETRRARHRRVGFVGSQPEPDPVQMGPAIFGLGLKGIRDPQQQLMVRAELWNLHMHDCNTVLEHVWTKVGVPIEGTPNGISSAVIGNDTYFI